MVALDFQSTGFAAPGTLRRFPGVLRALVVLLAASAVVLTGLVIRNASGWTTAADDLWRISIFAFAVALVWEPLGSLLPRDARQSLARQNGVVAAVFVLTYAAYLAFTFAPSWLAGTQPVVGMRVFGFLTAAACLFLAASALPRWPGSTGETLRRATQVATLGFFWVWYVLCGVDHLYGPHRPDRFFGIAVLALVAALLLRFAAAFVNELKIVLAGMPQTRRGAYARKRPDPGWAPRRRANDQRMGKRP